MSTTLFTSRESSIFPKLANALIFKNAPSNSFATGYLSLTIAKTFIPEYLTILRGAIDSPDIPLNVSRSYLQMDKTVRSLSAHISKKVADRLASIYRTDKKTFIDNFQDVEMILKLGIMHDDKFYDRVKDFLIWQNLDGEWTTLAEYLERHPDKIFYTQETDSPFLSVYKEKKIEVLIAKGPLDAPLMNFLELKLSPAKFQRIDGALDPSILDTAREKSLLDTEGKPESAKIADFVRTSLNIDHLEVEAKSLASDTLPAFILIDEQSRRMRETFALGSKELPPGLVDKKTFVVNTNSPLITSLTKHKDKELAKEVLTHLYQLAQLSQKELSPKELPAFIERSRKVLEQLLTEK